MCVCVSVYVRLHIYVYIYIYGYKKKNVNMLLYTCIYSMYKRISVHVQVCKVSVYVWSIMYATRS